MRLPRQLTAALLAVVMLFAALVPSVGMALASKSGVSWVEICSAQGVKRVAVNAAGEVIADQSEGKASRGAMGAALDHADEHCAFCHLQSTLPEPRVDTVVFYGLVAPTPAWNPTLPALSLDQPAGLRPFSIGPPALF